MFLVGSDRTIKELDGEKFGAGSCREFEISSSMSSLVACDVGNGIENGGGGNNTSSTNQNVKENGARRKARTLTSTCFLTSSRLLVCGTSCGSLRVYTTPLTGEFREYRCASNREITSICASDTEKRIFACSADGTMFAFEIIDDNDTDSSRLSGVSSRSPLFLA